MPDLQQHALVALTPQELIPAQQSIAHWCKQKIAALGGELRDQRQNLRQAKTMKWKHSGWSRMAARTAKRMIYYKKIWAAVDLGYLIIPNLPIEVIAVRVRRETPTSQYGTYPSDVIDAKPDLLPHGKGRYVDESRQVVDTSHSESDGKGGTNHVRSALSHYYQEEIDFPFLAVKPHVLAATHRAMVGRVFDQIGIAHGEETSSKQHRRSDPIVVGQLIDPRSTIYHRRVLSFFIAWYLNTEDL